MYTKHKIILMLNNAYPHS